MVHPIFDELKNKNIYNNEKNVIPNTFIALMLKYKNNLSGWTEVHKNLLLIIIHSKEKSNRLYVNYIK